MSRSQRIQRKTLLAVGEGYSEVAFLKHLKSIYCSGGFGVSVKVVNAYGRGPDNVIDHAISLIGTEAYDHRLCLLDTDIPWPTTKAKKAKQKKIYLIGSDPCLEGLLLEILQRPKGGNSEICKRNLRAITNASMTESVDYKKLFTKPILDGARTRINTLDTLITMFEGS